MFFPLGGVRLSYNRTTPSTDVCVCLLQNRISLIKYISLPTVSVSDHNSRVKFLQKPRDDRTERKSSAVIHQGLLEPQHDHTEKQRHAQTHVASPQSLSLHVWLLLFSRRWSTEAFPCLCPEARCLVINIFFSVNLLWSVWRCSTNDSQLETVRTLSYNSQ